MAAPLSLELRTRVVAAVAGGRSRRQAAVRFSVSAASAIRWRALERAVGGLWSAIGALIPAFAPRECANCFAVAGCDAG